MHPERIRRRGCERDLRDTRAEISRLLAENRSLHQLVKEFSVLSERLLKRVIEGR
jgi:hypothetical protein